jgi:hypothetical protein
MENENYLIRADKNIFRLDYSEQNINSNSDFLKWKKSMLEIYGKDAKLFHCLEDKIYYYVSKKEFNYKNACPICKRGICYLCKSNGYHEGCCCIRYKLYSMIYEDSKIYIEDPESHFYDYCVNNLTFDMLMMLIPIVSTIWIIGLMHSSFFYSLDKFKGKKSIRNQYFQSIEDKHEKILFLLVGVNAVFAIFIIVPFWSYALLFSLILDLLSFLSNFYPIKILAGVFENAI